MGLDVGEAGTPLLSAFTVRRKRPTGVLDRADDFGFAIEAVLAFECAGKTLANCSPMPSSDRPFVSRAAAAMTENRYGLRMGERVSRAVIDESPL